MLQGPEEALNSGGWEGGSGCQRRFPEKVAPEPCSRRWVGSTCWEASGRKQQVTAAGWGPGTVWWDLGLD